MAFSPDGRTLATVSGDRTLRLWDVGGRQPIGGPVTGHNGWVRAVEFSPDGKTIATASSDRTIQLWRVVG